MHEMKFKAIINLSLIFLLVYNQYCVCTTTIYKKKLELFCTANGGQKGDINNDLFNFDCSNQKLNFTSLDFLVDLIKASTSINLASNSFEHIIYNRSFEIFQLLELNLNLSSNQFKKIEPYGFFYLPKWGIYGDAEISQNGKLKPLQFVNLDLSNNSFELVPWESLKNLPKLKNVYFNLNPIKKLDYGDLNLSSFNTSDLNLDYFTELTHVHMSRCQIEFVDANLFKIFKYLQFLDISLNQIRHVSNEITLNAIDITYLNLESNPLECSCDLLWLKNFIKENRNPKQINNPTNVTCYINTSIHEDVHIVDEKFIEIDADSTLNKVTNRSNLMTNKAYNKNNIGTWYHNKNLTNLRNTNKSSMVMGSTRTLVPILSLDDDQFICELELVGDIVDINPKKTKTPKTIEFNCRVRSHPSAVIVWMYKQRLLQRLFVMPGFQFKIDDRVVSKKFDSTVIESKLIVTYSGQIANEDYSCRTSHRFNSSKNYEFVAKPIYDQKMINFNIINHSYVSELKTKSSNNSIAYSDASRAKILYDEKSDRQPYIYWIIFGACLAFVVVVIIFASICIIQNNRKLKSHEDIKSNDYNTINNRSAIYLASNSIYADASLVQPLKPDVRREHQYQDSLVTTMNKTSSSKTSTPSYIFSSPLSLPKQRLETTNCFFNDSEISYDNNPIESSIIDDTKSIGSKSFEENIEEYLDPKFDDLRKPSPKKKKKDLNNQNSV